MTPLAKRLGFALTALAVLASAAPSSAQCNVCVNECRNTASGLVCMETCYVFPCGGEDHGRVSLGHTPNLSVRQGSACTVKGRTGTAHGAVRGNACVLGR